MILFGGGKMNVYKLFSKSQSTEKVKLYGSNLEIITGSTDNVFGLKVEPEKYRESIKYIQKPLLKKKIRQHIMTDFKFLELVKQSKQHDFQIVDINFYNESSINGDDLFKELEEALWQSNTELIFKILQEIIKEGYMIFAMTIHVKNSQDQIQQIKIFANGTIAVEVKDDSNKEVYPIIDYIVKGSAITS